MDNLHGLDALPVHRALLERAVNYFRDDDRVVGMILGGSLAQGIADLYSDIALYLITRDESFTALFDERETAALALVTPMFRFAVDPIPGAALDGMQSVGRLCRLPQCCEGPRREPMRCPEDVPNITHLSDVSLILWA